MYHKYYILVVSLFLVGGSLAAKNYNDQDWASRENRDPTNGDFYLEEESEGSGPDDEEGDVDDFFGSGSGDGGLPNRPNKVVPPNSYPDETDKSEPDSPSYSEEDDNKIDIDVEPPTEKERNKLDPIPKEDDISIKDIDDLDSGNDDGDGVQQRRTAIVVAQPGILAEEPPLDTEPNPEHNQGRQGFSNTQARVERSPIIAQPGILAGIIGGAVVGLLCAVLLVMFIVYRMRKKDEGSYALDEPKRSPSLTYTKARDREFFA